MIRLPVWHLTTLKPIDVAITDTMSDFQEQPLKAAAFSPQVASPEGLAEAGHGRPKWLIPAAIALFMAAIVVFVLLPSVISTDNPATPVLTESAKLSGTPTQAGGTVSGDNPGEERSPFAEAQQQKLRKLAQDALQVVLEAQEALQEFSVERWAPEAYAAALAVAAEGDKAYRDRQFVEAAAAYQEAAAGLATLEDSISRRAQEARLKALSAIEAGDASAAKKQYELLTLLEPGDPELPGLLERTAKIPEVAAALETAAESAVKGDMGAAVKAA